MRKKIMKLIEFVFVVVITNLIIVTLICYANGMNSFEDFSTILSYAGIVNIILGVLSIVGNTMFKGNPAFHQGIVQSNGNRNFFEDLEKQDRRKSYTFFLFMIVCGVILIGISGVIA